MIYELWDIESANLLGAFDNKRDALVLALGGIERNGQHYADTLALVVEDEAGFTHPIAQGQQLAEMARREFSERRAAG